MNENKHISKEELLAFHHDRMMQDEKEKFLEHICSCDFCSGLLAESMEKELVKAPHDLKANLLREVLRPDIRLAVKVKETSKRMQLFLYSLKVGTATAGALLILLLTIRYNNNLSSDAGEIKDNPKKAVTSASLTITIRENMNSLSSNLLDFSNKIMKTEVNDDEKKEK